MLLILLPRLSYRLLIARVVTCAVSVSLARPPRHPAVSISHTASTRTVSLPFLMSPVLSPYLPVSPARPSRPQPWLDNKHTVFGRCSRGMEVCQNIGLVKTNPKTDKPYDDVTIINISVK